jgi:uncharacterized protein YceK
MVKLSWALSLRLPSHHCWLPSFFFFFFCLTRSFLLFIISLLFPNSSHIAISYHWANQLTFMEAVSQNVTKYVRSCTERIYEKWVIFFLFSFSFSPSVRWRLRYKKIWQETRMSGCGTVLASTSDWAGVAGQASAVVWQYFHMAGQMILTFGVSLHLEMLVVPYSGCVGTFYDPF